MHGVIRPDLYNPVWSECFQLEAKRLRKKLRQRVGQIEHIGSTAIPEMIAKPIIDLMASVDDLEEARSLISDIETLGYTYGENDEISDRHYFTLRLQDGIATHHLSLAEQNSTFWTEHILFRDYLVAHPKSRQEYANLKRRLAIKHAGDRIAYVEAKTEFIVRVLERARKETNF